MKRVLALLALAVLVAGCSKNNSSSSGTDQSSTATQASAAADSGSSSGGSSMSGSSSGTGEATTSSAAPDAAPSAAASGSFTAIDVPVYPGADKEPDKSMSMNSNGDSMTVDTYQTKDDSGTVVSWYKSHLPSDWQNMTMGDGSKTSASFTSQQDGEHGQSVVISGEEAETQIVVTSKVASK